MRISSKQVRRRVLAAWAIRARLMLRSPLQGEMAADAGNTAMKSAEIAAKAPNLARGVSLCWQGFRIKFRGSNF